MQESLGILVWTTLLAGSATVLFLALPDLVSWCLGLRERSRVTDRAVLEPRVVTHTMGHPSDPVRVRTRRR